MTAGIEERIRACAERLAKVALAVIPPGQLETADRFAHDIRALVADIVAEGDKTARLLGRVIVLCTIHPPDKFAGENDHAVIDAVLGIQAERDTAIADHQQEKDRANRLARTITEQRLRLDKVIGETSDTRAEKLGAMGTGLVGAVTLMLERYEAAIAERDAAWAANKSALYMQSRAEEDQDLARRDLEAVEAERDAALKERSAAMLDADTALHDLHAAEAEVARLKDAIVWAVKGEHEGSLDPRLAVFLWRALNSSAETPR